MTVQWRRVAFPLLAVAAILIFARTLSPVLSPVLLAMLLAVVLNPLVEAAARLRLPRAATVILLYIVLALALTFTGSAVVGQFNELTIAMGGGHARCAPATTSVASGPNTAGVHFFEGKRTNNPLKENR